MVFRVLHAEIDWDKKIVHNLGYIDYERKPSNEVVEQEIKKMFSAFFDTSGYGYAWALMPDEV